MCHFISTFYSICFFDIIFATHPPKKKLLPLYFFLVRKKCRKLLFYSQADNFLNFVHAHQCPKIIFSVFGLLCLWRIQVDGKWELDERDEKRGCWRHLNVCNVSMAVAGKKITLDFVQVSIFFRVCSIETIGVCVWVESSQFFGLIISIGERIWFARAVKGNSNKRNMRAQHSSTLNFPARIRCH